MKRPELPADLLSDAVDVLEDLAHEGCEPWTDCVGYTRPGHVELARRLLSGMVVSGPGGWGLHCGPCDRTLLACDDSDYPAENLITTALAHVAKPEHIAKTGGNPLHAELEEPEAVTVTEARPRLGDLVIAAKEGGRRFLITRNGKPAALLIPIPAEEKTGA